MKTTHETALKIIEDWMVGQGWDPEHMRQVARLAQQLFVQLELLHGLGQEDLFILKAASLTHDVGFIRNESRHHKHSYDMICETNFPGVSPDEQRLMALVARYHRKSPPKKKHKAFSALSPADQKRVRTLAALIRTADGLDRSHTNTVRDLDCRIGDDRITIHLITTHSPLVDLCGGRKKKDLMEKVFNKKVLFEIRA